MFANVSDYASIDGDRRTAKRELQQEVVIVDEDPLIETDRLCQLAADEDGLQRDARVGRIIVSNKPSLARSPRWTGALRDSDARAVDQCGFAMTPARPWVFIEARHLQLELPRMPTVVGIEKGQVPAGGAAEPCITCTRDVAAVNEMDDVDLAATRQHAKY